MSIPEVTISVQREAGIPDVSVCKVAGMVPSTYSLWKRGFVSLSDNQIEEIKMAIEAMVELQDETATPLDWRQVMKVKPILDAKIAGYRRARSAQLAREFRERFSTGNPTQDNV